MSAIPNISPTHVAIFFRQITSYRVMYRDADLRLLVAGGGRVGRKTAELLLEYGHAPVLVDHDEEVVKAL